MRYVCGLVIHGGTRVALVLKEQPAFFAGFYNGICGKVEFKKGDVSATVGMVRQFKEETGVDTDVDDWEIVGNLFIGRDIVHFFKCNMDSARFDKITTVSDELIVTFDIDSVMGKNFPLDKYAKLFLLASLDGRMEMMNITING